MVIEKKPFENYTLDEDKPKGKGRPLTIWLNDEEDAQLTKDMELLDMGVDAAAVKWLMGIGRDTVYGLIGTDRVRYLVSRKRTRFDGRKR